MPEPELQLAHAIATGRLQRYLSVDLGETISQAAEAGQPLGPALLEAFVHLTAARYTISTYLPRQLAQKLLDSPLSYPWLAWEQGSLLFADLSGSTALAERLASLGREGTELVTDALNQIFSKLLDVIESYGGDLITFGGDALLVFFGDAEHPHTAARAALALQDVMHGYTQDVPGIGSFPLHLHIGIESGGVAFASAGLEHSRFFFALGATVNQVAVAEGIGQLGQVVAGPVAAAALSGVATGQVLEDGFLLLEGIAPPETPYVLPREPEPIVQLPEQAIPLLLEDLSSLSPYLPPVLLDKIVAEPERPQVEAELRPVTVLFAQIVGLEALAELLSERASAEALQVYVAAMQEAIELYGGVINKIDVADEGMKLVAIFGAPTAYEDHAERAALAALEMQERMDDVQVAVHAIARQQRDNWQPPALRQRIGLNLGSVFAGNVGSASRKEYTVMGDAVNVAARVMSASTFGEIWGSAEVMAGISTRLLCEERTPVKVKGKAQPLALCRISARRDPAVDELLLDDGPLVGREHELAWLHEQISGAAAGQGRALRIVGEAGVGKSRLAAALLAEARRAGFQVISAPCFSYTAGIPYAAWAEWLKPRCGIVSGDTDPERIQKMSAALAALEPGTEEWLPVLGDLARLDIPENRLTRGLDPRMRQARRFELISRLLLHAAKNGPVLTLFEDLHWADPISLELWQELVPQLAEHAVLLVGVHRPGLDLPEDATAMLKLGELSSDDSSAMVAALSDSALPEPVLRQIVERAAGNPLFLSELIHAVRNNQENQSGTVADLPDSLNGLLLARIDRLDETSRNVLRIASVIGQRFPFGVLRAIQAHEQSALVRQLARLDQHDLTLLERVEPERVHVFRHALIQEVAYQSMLYSRRRELHGRIGAYLERRYGDDLDDYIGLIAHHYRLSDRREKAVSYLQQAGDAARAIFANEEAIQYYTWALEAIGDESDERAWQAHNDLAEVYTTVGRYETALAELAAVMAVPYVAADAARRALAQRGSVLEKLGQYPAALEALDQAMSLARSGGIPRASFAISHIYADIALVRKRQGDYAKAIDACEQGLAVLQDDPNSSEDEQIEAQLHSELGGIFGMQGNYARARTHFEHSLQIREMIDDLPGLAAAHNNVGYLWQLQSEYEQAIEHYTLAEEIARKINLRFMLVFASGNAAYAFMCLGRYDEAEASCQEVLSLARELNIQNNIAQAYDMLGLISYYRGNYGEAVERCNEALAIHHRLGSSPQRGSVLVHTAQSLLSNDDLSKAQHYAEQALHLGQSEKIPRLHAEALMLLAEMAIRHKNSQQAKEYLDQASTALQDVNSKNLQGIFYRLKGLIEADQAQNSSSAFQESLRLLQETKDTFEQGRTYAAYGSALRLIDQHELAAEQLKHAYDAFTQVGAQGELRRIASLIRKEEK